MSSGRRTCAMARSTRTFSSCISVESYTFMSRILRDDGVDGLTDVGVKRSRSDKRIKALSRFCNYLFVAVGAEIGQRYAPKNGFKISFARFLIPANAFHKRLEELSG